MIQELFLSPIQRLPDNAIVSLMMDFGNKLYTSTQRIASPRFRVSISGDF